MLRARYIVGFTGHRALPDEEAVREGIRKTIATLQAACAGADGRLEAYCSVAEGSDTVFAEVAAGSGMPVHIILPLPVEEFRKDFHSPDAWSRSLAILETARQPGRGSVWVVPTGSARPDCYGDQGAYMLEVCDVVVSVWDKEQAKGVGGTAQVIAQARRQGIPVVVISPVDGSTVEADDFPQVFCRDPVLTELNEVAALTTAPGAAGVDSADRLQDSLDHIAIQEASRFRPSLVRIILVHAVAALLAAVATFKLEPESAWDDWKWIITAIELVLVSWAFQMTRQLRRRHTQQRWIRCRFACELVRGLRFSVPILDPLHPTVRYHDPVWSRFALSAGLLVQDGAPADDIRKLRDHYVSTRLSDSHSEGQIRHFLEKRPRAERGWKITDAVGTWSATLAPIFVGLSLLGKGVNNSFGLHLERHFELWMLFYFFPIALPLTAGAAGAIRHALDAGRRRHRYPDMVARLSALRTRLEELETSGAIRHTVAQIEDVLLDELREWRLSASASGAH